MLKNNVKIRTNTIKVFGSTACAHDEPALMSLLRLFIFISSSPPVIGDELDYLHSIKH